LGVVGKGKLFWFFSVGFMCRQKPNVLERAEGFSTMRHNKPTPEAQYQIL
jgi:hypothetical protein